MSSDPSALRRHRLLLALQLVGLAVGMVQPRVAAAQARVHLDWRVPASSHCLDAEGLEAAVEARLGRPVFAHEREGLFALEGELTVEPDSLRVHLDLRDPEGRSLGTRVLHATGRCEELSDSLALVVSLLVDQNQRRIVLYVPPPAPPPPVAPPPAIRPHLHSAPQRGAWEFTYALGASLRGLDAPWPTWGLVQTLRFSLPSVPLAFTLEASLTPPRIVRGEGSRAQVWDWTAGLGVCPELRRHGRVRSLTCVSVLAGEQHAEGRGLDEDRSGRGRTLRLVLRGGAEARVRGALHFGLAARLEAALLRADLVFGVPGDERTLFAGQVLGLGLEAWISLKFSGS